MKRRGLGEGVRNVEKPKSKVIPLEASAGDLSKADEREGGREGV